MIIKVVAALLFNERGEILITQRPRGSHLAGLWEFPGGKIHPDETPEAALIREVKEELDVDIQVDALFWQGTFDYTEKVVDLSFYTCSFINGFQQVTPIEVDDFRWVPVHQLSKFEFPPADTELINRLSGCETGERVFKPDLANR